MLGPDARFSVRGDEVAAKAFDDEVVVVHLGTCTYYSVSGSGADAWIWIGEGRPLAEVAAALADRWKIEIGRARADVEAYADRLLEEGLIAPANGEAPPAATPPPPAERGEYAPPDLQAYRDMADLLALDPPLPELDRPAWRATGDDGRG